MFLDVFKHVRFAGLLLQTTLSFTEASGKLNRLTQKSALIR